MIKKREGTKVNKKEEQEKVKKLVRSFPQKTEKFENGEKIVEVSGCSLAEQVWYRLYGWADGSKSIDDRPGKRWETEDQENLLVKHLRGHSVGSCRNRKQTFRH